MKHQARILLLAAIALPCVGAAAGELAIDCPESIAAVESLSTADDAWRVETDLGKRGKFLDSISVFSGPPAEMASLVPDRTSRKKQLRTSTWLFPCTSVGNILGGLHLHQQHAAIDPPVARWDAALRTERAPAAERCQVGHRRHEVRIRLKRLPNADKEDGRMRLSAGVGMRKLASGLLLGLWGTFASGGALSADRRRSSGLCLSLVAARRHGAEAGDDRQPGAGQLGGQAGRHRLPAGNHVGRLSGQGGGELLEEESGSIRRLCAGIGTRG